MPAHAYRPANRQNEVVSNIRSTSSNDVSNAQLSEILAGAGKTASGSMDDARTSVLDRMMMPGWGLDWGEPEPKRQTDPSDPWSDESLAARLEFDDDLAGKASTAQMMRDLSNDEDTPEAEDARQKALAKLAKERGLSVKEMQAQYETFKDKRKEAERIRKEKGLPAITELDEKLHPDHMGSIQQLRAGSYAGQAFGIDPVFGALLSPTAGLVGPGNDSYAADPDSVASYHGEAHDAFGYLKTYHDYGPGYRYATADENGPAATSKPEYTGQASGFRKWNELMADKGMADPDHPNDPDAQMRESLKKLGHLPDEPEPELPPYYGPHGLRPNELPVAGITDAVEWLLTRPPEHYML